MAPSARQAKTRGSRSMVQRMFSSQERSFADRNFVSNAAPAWRRARGSMLMRGRYTGGVGYGSLVYRGVAMTM
jgi:hypothetical protein